MKVFLNLLGIAVVIGLLFLISWDRKNIRWKAVGKAIIAQFIIAILLVKVPVGKMVVSAISDGGMPGVFVGGDCATGPATAIKAIAAGKVAAHNIDEYLGYHHTLNCGVEAPEARENNRVPTGRVNIGERPAYERKHDFEHVECPMTHEEAMQESGRCLRCDVFGCGKLQDAIDK